MEQTVRLFNHAMNYFQEERFEEAELLLEQLVKGNSSFSEAKWALGLLQVLSGSPHQALQIWKKLKAANLLSYKQMVEEKLPQYDEVYEKYNQALELIQAEDFIQAKNIFEELLSIQQEVPLPVDFYHGYLLTLIVTGEEGRVAHEIYNFPLYVKNSSVIHEVEKNLSNKRPKELATAERMVVSELPVEQVVPVVQDSPKKGWSNGLFIGSGMAASILIGALGMWAFGDTKEVNPVIQQNEGNSTEDMDKSKTLEKELSVLKEEKTNLEKDLESKKLELSKQEEFNDIISVANSDRTELSVTVGWNTYKTGLAAFKNKEYRKAVELMEKSLAIQSNEYFSDDALFFLIKSKQRLNQKEDLLPLYELFFSQNSNHYVLSPYRDDLMLSKAKLLIENGNSQDALLLLEKIRTEYKQEWTAEEATLLITKIMKSTND